MNNEYYRSKRKYVPDQLNFVIIKQFSDYKYKSNPAVQSQFIISIQQSINNQSTKMEESLDTFFNAFSVAVNCSLKRTIRHLAVETAASEIADLTAMMLEAEKDDGPNPVAKAADTHGVQLEWVLLFLGTVLVTNILTYAAGFYTGKNRQKAMDRKTRIQDMEAQANATAMTALPDRDGEGDGNADDNNDADDEEERDTSGADGADGADAESADEAEGGDVQGNEPSIRVPVKMEVKEEKKYDPNV